MTSALIMKNQSSELNSYYSISEGSTASQASSSHFTSMDAAAPSTPLNEKGAAAKESSSSADINAPTSLTSINYLRSMISTTLTQQETGADMAVPQAPPPATATQPCSQFIDPTELKNKLFEFSSKFLLILLDCRTYTDFNLKHIKDSVHLNCRDKLTRKRLQTRKLTVRDLISSEEIKNKLDDETEQSQKNLTIGNLVNCAMSQAECASTLITTRDPKKSADKMIVLYDDTTSDLSDLQSDQNPLKIVQENIKQSGYKKDCKILKGGFKSFFEMCPEFCVLKDANEQRLAFINKHKEYYLQLKDDQRQSAIDNAVMTEITPFLFLGNESDAKNCDILEKKGIYYILNVTKNIPFYNSTNTVCGSGNTDKTNKKQFFHKRIAVNDCENQNLKNYFNEAFDFIDLAKLNNQKVLVHCQAGISRSPTIVVAYLMSKLHLDMNDAYNQVKNQRPIIGPNLIFMSQLMDFEINLHKNNAKNPDSLNYKSSAPPSTPIIQSTQIQFNNQKENSENNSPDVVNASSNSYFKLQAANKCLNSNSGENNSILVFN